MNMKKRVDEMLEKKVWAVVGATNNKDKFGNKIYLRLKNAGYEVYPVNPVYEEVEGDKCYESLEALPKQVDCVDVVVSPKRSLNVIEDAVKAGVPRIWFQPGTYNDEITQKAEEADLSPVYGHCVLVELGNIGK